MNAVATSLEMWETVYLTCPKQDDFFFCRTAELSQGCCVFTEASNRCHDSPVIIGFHVKEIKPPQNIA